MIESIERPLIHIGYHKTGSSWLQQHLFTDANDVFYPLSRKSTGQSTLSKHFIMDDNRHLLSSFESNSARIKRELSDILALRGPINGAIPVISQERLSGNPGASGFDAKTISWRLQDAFPDARILIVVREQRSFIRSLYFYYLASGGTDSFEKYVGAKYDGIQPYFSPHHINYVGLVQEYIRLFGQQNVLVTTYELFRNDPAKYLSSLESFLGVSFQISPQLYRDKVNEIMSPFFNYHLRMLNRFRIRTSHNHHSLVANSVTNKLVNTLHQGLNKYSIVSLDKAIIKKIDEKTAAWVGDRYLASNKILDEYTSCDLRAFGYY